uniref:Pp1b n=1 Tax=Cladonema pacificum TaxID=499903 RepID=A0A1W6LRZ0_9CNID|nr:pp1b precursor [Cladonema pacificum]
MISKAIIVYSLVLLILPVYSKFPKSRFSIRGNQLDNGYPRGEIPKIKPDMKDRERSNLLMKFAEALSILRTNQNYHDGKPYSKDIEEDFRKISSNRFNIRPRPGKRFLTNKFVGCDEHFEN